MSLEDEKCNRTFPDPQELSASSKYFASSTSFSSVLMVMSDTKSEISCKTKKNDKILHLIKRKFFIVMLETDFNKCMEQYQYI